MPRTTINSLQAGRGLAALAVVVHHSNLAAHDFGGASLGVLNYGYLGVDFFFVLSGFIIFHSTAGSQKTPRTFAGNRIRRIYLPYWPVGIGIALLYIALPSMSQAHRSWSWLPTLTLLPIDADTALKVAWTLKHEILFYVLFGAAYFSRLLWPILAVWAALIMFGCIAGINTVALQSINLEFIFGIIAAIATHKGMCSPWLLVGSVASFILWMGLGTPREQSCFVGSAFAFLIPLIVGTEWRGKMRVPPILVFLGAASYSLYLVHPLFTPLAGRLLQGHPLEIFLFGVAGSLVLGISYYLGVERPILRGKVAMPWSVIRRSSNPKSD